MGFERNIEHIRKLNDDANVKAVILANAKEIVTKLAQKERFALKEEDVSLLHALLDKNIIYTPNTNIGELEAVASQAVNQALGILRLEKPGFATEFMDALKNKMTIH